MAEVIKNEVLIKDVPHQKRSQLSQVVPLKQPYVIYIDPCGACNLNCTFCPCNTSQECKKERHEKMDFDLFCKIVDDMKKFPEKVRVVYLFCFGEPLLNPRIFDMISYLKKSDVCDVIRMYTNGLLLTPEVSDQLVDSGLDLLRVSLNGLTQEHYKEFCQVNMDYQKFLEHLHYFYQVSRGKVEFVIKVSNLFLETKENKQLLHDLFYDQCDYLFVEDIYDTWSEFDGVTTKEENRMDCGRVEKEICSSPMTTMVIHSNGAVSPCCADWKFSVVYGNVGDTALEELWYSEDLKKLMVSLLKRETKRYSFCDACEFITSDTIEEEGVSKILSRLNS